MLTAVVDEKADAEMAHEKALFAEEPVTPPGPIVIPDNFRDLDWGELQRLAALVAPGGTAAIALAVHRGDRGDVA